MANSQALLDKYGVKQDNVGLLDKYGVKPVLQQNLDPQSPVDNSVLGKVANFAQQNINEPVENLARPIENFAGGVGQGIVNFPGAVANLPINVLNSHFGTNLPTVPQLDVIPHGTASSLGDLASMFAGPGGWARGAKAGYEALKGTALGKNMLAIPMISKALSAASDVMKGSPRATQIAKNAVIGGAYSPSNPLLGMTGGALLPEMIKAAPAIKNAFTGQAGLGGNMSPEELQRALEVTKGTATPLGDVIQSPMLKKVYENMLSQIPLSGVYDTMQKGARDIKAKGEQILSDLAGGSAPENHEKLIVDALKEAHATELARKNDLYSKLNQKASDEGFDLQLPNFYDKAKQYKDAIEGTGILKTEPEMKGILGRLSNYQGPSKFEAQTPDKVAESIQKIINGESPENISASNLPNLHEATLLKGKFGQLERSYGQSPLPDDRRMASIFGDLSRALKGDIVGSMEKDGHGELLKNYQKAEENYANNYAPFLDPQVYKFIRGPASSDNLIQNFIKTGPASDQAELLSKLTEKLPADKRDLVGHAFLKRALDENGELNPLKLRQLLNPKVIGPRQFKALFSPEMQKRLRDYSSLVGKNAESFSIMNNPATGARLQSLIPLGLFSAGNALAGPIGGLASAVGIPYAARKAANALTSETVRNKVVNRLINRSK